MLLEAISNVNFVDTIINTLESYISVPFILSTNLITYISLKIAESFNKDRVFTTIEKRFTVSIVTTILFAVFFVTKISTLDVLILSAVISPFSYAYVIKKIFKVLGITPYRKDLNNFLND